MDILKKIEMFREEEEKLRWEGSFADYLLLLKEKPWVAQSAHSRVYNMIKDAGIEEVKREQKNTSSLPVKLFGLEEHSRSWLRNIFIPQP